MRITPLDVRKQEFRRGMRGYDCDEVRAFLTNLADEYEAVLVDNKQLRERILDQDEKLVEYRHLETTLRDTLMTAEKVMQEAKEGAHREADVLMQEARQKVEQTLAAGRAKLEELRREALALHREKEAYLGRFRSLAEAQIQFVESHRKDFAEIDGRMLEVGHASPSAAATPRPAPASPATPASRPAPDAKGPEAGLDVDPWSGSPAAATPPPARPAVSEHDQWRDYEPGASAPKNPPAAKPATPPAPEPPQDRGPQPPRDQGNAPGGATEDEIEKVASALQQAEGKGPTAGPAPAPKETAAPAAADAGEPEKDAIRSWTGSRD